MRNMIKAEVGSRLRDVRLTLGYSVSRMAVLLNLNKMTYVKNENGTHFPGAVTLINLSTEYNVSIDWLLCNRGTMFYGEKDQAKKLLASKDEVQIDEMVNLMKNIPLAYHSMITSFLRFKVDNEAYLDREMARLKETAEAK